MRLQNNHFPKTINELNKMVVVDHFNKFSQFILVWGFTFMYTILFFALSYFLSAPWIVFSSIAQLSISILGGFILIKMSELGVIEKWKYNITTAMFIFPLILFGFELLITFLFIINYFSQNH